MSTTLVHIGVRASDLETTIRFWRDGLGLPVFSQMENCHDLSVGTSSRRGQRRTLSVVWFDRQHYQRPARMRGSKSGKLSGGRPHRLLSALRRYAGR